MSTLMKELTEIQVFQVTSW